MTAIRLSVSEGSLLGTNEVYVTDSVVADEEQSMLLRWADVQYRNGKLLENPRDPRAHTTPFRSANRSLTALTNARAHHDGLSNRPLVWVPTIVDEPEAAPPGKFWRIRSRVIDLLGLSELQEDHYKGSFVSHITPGAGIHWHRDSALEIAGDDANLVSRRALLAELHGEAAAQGASGVQLDLLKFVLMFIDDFSVKDAAESIRRSPSETLEGLQGLQRANMVESHSSTSFTQGRVIVL